MIKRRQIFSTFILSLFTLLILSHCSSHATPPDPLVAEISFGNEKQVIIRIQTNMQPEYILTDQPNESHQFRITNIENAALRCSDSPLWKFFPLELREINHQSGSTFHLLMKTNHPYSIRHSANKRAITLQFTGQVAQETWADIIRYGSRYYNQLDAREQKVLQQVLTAAESSPGEPFLLRQLQQSKRQQQYTWYRLLYQHSRHRAPVSPEDLQWLARYFERMNDQQSASLAWYDFYQQVTATGENQYTDVLPAAAGKPAGTRANHQHSRTTDVQSTLPVRGYGFLLVLVGLGVGVLGLKRNKVKSIFVNLWPRSKKEEEEVNDFQQFLDEIHEKLRTSNPAPVRDESNSAGKFDSESGDEKRKPEPDRHEPAGSVRENSDRQSSKEAEKSSLLLKQAEVMELYRSEMEPEVIARNLHMSRGEVELLITISQQEERIRSGTRRREKLATELLSEQSIRDLSRSMHISEEEAKIMRLKSIQG